MKSLLENEVDLPISYALCRTRQTTKLNPMGLLFLLHFNVIWILSILVSRPWSYPLDELKLTDELYTHLQNMIGWPESEIEASLS